MHIGLVMTIIGPDRPGLVDLVAGIVMDHAGNWLESRMSRLGGQFAGILRVQVPSDRESDLVLALQQIDPQRLAVLVNRDTDSEPGGKPAAQAVLEIVGHDRPGIIRQISGALAGHGVNVEELHTERLSAPMSGELLFKARARLQFTPDNSLESLRADLEKIAADLAVDLNLSPAETGA